VPLAPPPATPELGDPAAPLDPLPEAAGSSSPPHPSSSDAAMARRGASMDKAFRIRAS
jgi:hypothetical protein